MAELIHAEILLAKYFNGHTQAENAKAVVFWVRKQLSGVTRRQIHQARKNLGIRSYADGEDHMWAWESPIPPGKVWESKSLEVFGRKRDK